MEANRKPVNTRFISPSQLNLYSNCGEAYRRRYIEHEKIPPGIAALRGRSVDGAATQNHLQKMRSGEDLPIRQMLEIAAAEFERAEAEGYTITQDEASIGVKTVVAQEKDTAIRLTELYGQQVAPTIQPELVQTKINVPIQHAEITLTGVIDVATTDKRVKDLKTAQKSKNQTEADTSMQLSFYAAAYQALTGMTPAGLDLEVLVNTKTPKHQRLSTVRSPRDVETLTARINVMLRAIDAGVFPPANPGNWLCSPKWCGYFHSCPYVNPERIAAAEAAN